MSYLVYTELGDDAHKHGRWLESYVQGYEKQPPNCVWTPTVSRAYRFPHRREAESLKIAMPTAMHILEDRDT